MRVLVVAAHPDDEVLGCGATIARHTDAGDEVHVLILGEGSTSRSPRREDADRAEVARLRGMAAAAGDVLGVKTVTVLDLPDNRFDTVPLLDVVKRVEEEVERREPELVYTHHGGDLNIDHGVVCRAVLTATRPVPGCGVHTVFAFEVPSSTEWAFGQLEPRFAPNHFVGVAETLDRKVAALREYDGELRELPHPRSAGGLEALARRWGSAVGLTAAEAFVSIREVRP